MLRGSQHDALCGKSLAVTGTHKLHKRDTRDHVANLRKGGKHANAFSEHSGWFPAHARHVLRDPGCSSPVLLLAALYSSDLMPVGLKGFCIEPLRSEQLLKVTKHLPTRWESSRGRESGKAATEDTGTGQKKGWGPTMTSVS